LYIKEHYKINHFFEKDMDEGAQYGYSLTPNFLKREQFGIDPIV